MNRPQWVRNELNGTRRLGDHSGLSRVSDTVEGSDQWISWDFDLESGRYALSFVSESAVFLNYFAVGTIPQPNQPEPIFPQDRFGVICNRADLLEFRAPVLFQVAPGQIIRIESWAQIPDKINPQPLPGGWERWRTFTGSPPTVSWWLHNTFGFFHDFHSVSRRTFFDDRIVFGAEDGGDNDFNDLVVALARAGD